MKLAVCGNGLAGRDVVRTYEPELKKIAKGIYTFLLESRLQNIIPSDPSLN